MIRPTYVHAPGSPAACFRHPASVVPKLINSLIRNSPPVCVKASTTAVGAPGVVMSVVDVQALIASPTVEGREQSVAGGLVGACVVKLNAPPMYPIVQRPYGELGPRVHRHGVPPRAASVREARRLTERARRLDSWRWPSEVAWSVTSSRRACLPDDSNAIGRAGSQQERRQALSHRVVDYVIVGAGSSQLAAITVPEHSPRPIRRAPGRSQ